jgi:hypothetical protein
MIIIDKANTLKILPTINLLPIVKTGNHDPAILDNVPQNFHPDTTSGSRFNPE